MEVPMMRCGHAANSVVSKHGGKTIDPPAPGCCICNCIEVAATPALEGRRARCTYSRKSGSCPQEYRDAYGNQHHCNCPDKKSQPSSMDLAFFSSKHDGPEDEFYCGCMGWD